MSTPALPKEILHPIIECAKHDTATLVKLCLVCRGLRPDVQPVLYADITLSGLDREVLGRPTRAMLFMKTTTLCPSLAQNVRSFSYYGRELRYDWWERMNRALQNMVNLKSFTLEGIRLPHATTLFDNCSVKLHRLTWVDHDRQDSLRSDHEEALKRFLSTQPEIKSLSVPFQEAQISPPICPQLNVLIGDSRTIIRVLPARQTVTKLVLNEVRQSSDIKIIAQELPHVRIFVLGSPYPRHELVIFIPYLTNVQTIRLFGRAPGTSLEYELEHISSLSQLRIFIWSPGILSQLEYADLIREERQRALVSRWFQAIPTMHAAYFARCLPKQDAKCYSRWTRDGATSHVTPDEYMRLGNVEY